MTATQTRSTEAAQTASWRAQTIRTVIVSEAKHRRLDNSRWHQTKRRRKEKSLQQWGASPQPKPEAHPFEPQQHFGTSAHITSPQGARASPWACLHHQRVPCQFGRTPARGPSARPGVWNAICCLSGAMRARCHIAAARAVAAACPCNAGRPLLALRRGAGRPPLALPRHFWSRKACGTAARACFASPLHR